MTFFVKCNTCGKEQESNCNSIGDPVNPINPDTGAKWYVRLKDGKSVHACCREHIPEKEVVWPT